MRRRSQHRPPPASRACPTALEQRPVHENPPCDPHRARQKKRASKASALLGLAGGPPTVLATASGGSPARRPHAPRALAPQGLSRGLSCGAIVRGYRIVAPSFGPRLRTAPPPPLACVALRCLPPLPCPPRLRRPCGLRLPPPVASRRDALSWSSPPISPDLALSSPELPLSSPHPATRVSERDVGRSLLTSEVTTRRGQPPCRVRGKGPIARNRANRANPVQTRERLVGVTSARSPLLSTAILTLTPSDLRPISPPLHGYPNPHPL